MKDTLISAPIPQVRLIMASGEPLPIVGCVKAPIRIDRLAVSHQFVVVERLVTPCSYPWAGLFTATQLSLKLCI